MKQDFIFFDRDLSWLSFNYRILQEAARDDLPLLERINFLAIYSSNLDEFYRVRMPGLMFQEKNLPVKGYTQMHTQSSTLYKEASENIAKQLGQYGRVLTQQIIPQLKEKNIHLVYCEAIPAEIKIQVQQFFCSTLMSYIQVKKINAVNDFFPENNKLYIAINVQRSEKEEIYVINIPSDKCSRFFSVKHGDITYVIFIDDILKENLHHFFPDAEITGAYSIKATRDAELELDEEDGDIALKIEDSLNKRDMRFVSRLLYQPGMPFTMLQFLISAFNMQQASVVEGGAYHNLRDFFGFPVRDASLSYKNWPAVNRMESCAEDFFELMSERDFILHTPYESYDMVLRFFNEAAVNPDVTEICTTLYRVAGDSKIANALISAANNGKKVLVFVELKARFDEANNIKWSKLMKAAGVKIIYSIPGLKVHAKIALVKRREGLRMKYHALLSTGNLNESTARIYTDHILFTSHDEITRELELLFIFLSYRRKPVASDKITFNHLLVAQFNLQQRFLSMIEREIDHAKNGRPASITIKLNNLEERILIRKLYEASDAGVKVQLIARSICCLVPGMEGVSENIVASRIVDRYLEHGRVFIFHNNGNEEIYMGSADWMNRNIYSRIEVCFPVYDEKIKEEIKQIISLQFADSVQAMTLNENMENVQKHADENAFHSQQSIYTFVKAKETL